MKKIALAFLAALTLGLVACGPGDTGNGDGGTTTTDAGETTGDAGAE